MNKFEKSRIMWSWYNFPAAYSSFNGRIGLKIVSANQKLYTCLYVQLHDVQHYKNPDTLQPTRKTVGGNIYSQLFWQSAARGFGTKFSQVEPTKV